MRLISALSLPSTSSTNTVAQRSATPQLPTTGAADFSLYIITVLHLRTEQISDLYSLFGKIVRFGIADINYISWQSKDLNYVTVLNMYWK
jgi:hypothetical protein